MSQELGRPLALCPAVSLDMMHILRKELTTSAIKGRGRCRKILYCQRRLVHAHSAIQPDKFHTCAPTVQIKAPRKRMTGQRSTGGLMAAPNSDADAVQNAYKLNQYQHPPPHSRLHHRGTEGSQKAWHRQHRQALIPRLDTWRTWHATSLPVILALASLIHIPAM